ncbi:FAD-dependent oxidoreductase, partial [Acinetobacter baumannii]
QNRSVRDPHRLVVALVERFGAIGGLFATGDVVGFDRGDDLTALRLADGRRSPATSAILCGGAHTGALSRMLGEPIPLETERGYHTQI